MKLSDFDIGSAKKDLPSPKERLPMIKKVFKLVLNREPSSRELSFYKYGVQTKEEVVEKLLNSEEHKEMLKTFKKFPKLEERAKSAEHKASKLKQNIEDSGQEELHLKNLLDEKNREIAILRKKAEDPYNFTHSKALSYIKGLTENNRDNVNHLSHDSTPQQIESNHYSSISSSHQKESKETFIDKIYKILNLN
ncbi:hypothetical protein K8R20_02240 [bacterium]|nr:hypothetical protein [bacterium]